MAQSTEEDRRTELKQALSDVLFDDESCAWHACPNCQLTLTKLVDALMVKV